MRTRVFVRQPDLLTEMLVLRLQGWSGYALAREYGVDKTTIKHWCDEFEIEPLFGGEVPARQITTVTFIPTPSKVPYKYQHLLDEEETVNGGLNYLQYRVESRRRELKKMGVI